MLETRCHTYQNTESSQHIYLYTDYPIADGHVKKKAVRVNVNEQTVKVLDEKMSRFQLVSSQS